MGTRIELRDAGKNRVVLPRVQNLAREGVDGWAQPLSLQLEGITAGDYLAWVRDSEPRSLGRELRSVTVDAEPLGERIDVELWWEREPPTVRTAAGAAGFALTPQVVAVHPGETSLKLHRRDDWRSR